jgi:hypothetical protein
MGIALAVAVVAFGLMFWAVMKRANIVAGHRGPV